MAPKRRAGAPAAPAPLPKRVQRSTRAGSSNGKRKHDDNGENNGENDDAAADHDEEDAPTGPARRRQHEARSEEVPSAASAPAAAPVAAAATRAPAEPAAAAAAAPAPMSLSLSVVTSLDGPQRPPASERQPFGRLSSIPRSASTEEPPSPSPHHGTTSATSEGHSEREIALNSLMEFAQKGHVLRLNKPFFEELARFRRDGEDNLVDRCDRACA